MLLHTVLLLNGLTSEALWSKQMHMSLPKWDFNGSLSKDFNYNGPRTYHVLLPPGYPQEAPYPVALLFHGCESSAAALFAETRISEVGLHMGYILVYLEGIPKSNGTAQDPRRTWNGGCYCGEAAANNVDDVKYTLAVITSILSRFHTHKYLVFLAGVSEGASMALRVGCELSGRVAGVAAVGGSFESRDGSRCAANCTTQSNTTSCDWSQSVQGCSEADWQQQLPPVYTCPNIRFKQIPVMMINGNLNPMAKISGSIDIGYPSHDRNSSYSPIHFVPAFFRKQYGCSDEAEIVTYRNGSKGNSTECRSWTGCTNVTFCISEAGDWWYGDNYDYEALCRLKGRTNCSFQEAVETYGPFTTSIHATEETFQFFHQFSADPNKRYI